MPKGNSSARPCLILYAARYQNAQKNAVAATLAWMSARHQFSFDVYYDAMRAGRHYGGGHPDNVGLEVLTGGLVSGGRHLEALALALQRFRTIVVCSGNVAFSNALAALSDASGADVYETGEDAVVTLYEAAFSALQVPWPETAVMLNCAPTPSLAGVDAYCYPEIFYRQAVGIEATAQTAELQALLKHGVQQILTCGVTEEQQAALHALGFHVTDLGVIRDEDDYASVTYRLAKRWQDKRRGWLIGDPTLVSYWLPTACREHRASIYSIPQSRVVTMLADDIAATTLPVLGRQFEDEDFFTLSRLGQSFQLIDPCRPPLPVLQTIPTQWSSSIPDPRSADPSDTELYDYIRQDRVLVTLVFWTGMIRETENLFALMDLLALTGLRAGIALTAQSLAWRPSPLDLVTVPRDQGGVFPNAEILLASCGTGAAIESLLSPEQLYAHLLAAKREMELLGVPPQWWPEGWWATMDAPLVELKSWRAPKPLRWTSSPPFVQFRYHRRDTHTSHSHPRPESHEKEAQTEDNVSLNSLRSNATTFRRRVRDVVRESRAGSLFEGYRPYEHFEPGAVLPKLAGAVQRAGFTYMLSKSGFGRSPHIVYRDGDFVALNYTAGQWDGWTPFETINDVQDLRRAEKTLLASGRPGWLLGGIDTCLWAFSGEVWDRAPGLAAIARYVASGGSSGKLINVTPRTLARYARLISAQSE